MNNTYVSEKYNIVEALDEIDAFIVKMKKFMDKHPEYSYSISIDKQDRSWIVKLNVKNG